jgi:hypothetical protein
LAGKMLDGGDVMLLGLVFGLVVLRDVRLE